MSAVKESFMNRLRPLSLANEYEFAAIGRAYMKRVWGVVIAVTLGLFAAQPSRAADGPAGIWLTGDGDAKVHIYDCGGMFCGKII